MTIFRMRNLNKFKPLAYSSTSIFLIALICTLFASKRIILNSTNSLPHGFYYVSRQTTYSYGDVVCFNVPSAVQQMVIDRGWLKKGHVMLKKIAAMPGDTVCINDDSFTVQSTSKGLIQHKDSQGRSLPQYRHCGPLTTNQIFVAHTEDSQSFDSRYFGPVPTQDIIGVATPLWIF